MLLACRASKRAAPDVVLPYAMQVQDLMMQQGTGWSPDVLGLPDCQPQLSACGRLVWYGPRVRMGMYEDAPTAVMPHSTSGRADYFGPLVNRYVPSDVFNSNGLKMHGCCRISDANQGFARGDG